MYDKFLQIEGWAYRGRYLVEKEEMEKAKDACLHIRYDLEELEVLLKIDQ
jgi:hypothetical protein